MKGAFVAAGLLLVVVIALTGPALRDPDSTLYAAMSTQLAARPLATWIAPEWPEGRAKSGPFIEHPAVSLWPGAAIESALPSPCAAGRGAGERGEHLGALIANALCALMLLWLVGRLAEGLAPGTEVIAWATWGLSIIAVQYWLRANHEIWWATAATAALLGVVSRWPRWLVIVFTLAGCAIKGALGLGTVLLVAPLAWVIHGRRWLLLYAVFTTLGLLALLGLYDAAYRAVTGASFLRAYVSTQFGYVMDSEGSAWLAKPRNLVVYAGKLIWFSLPGALLLGWGRRRLNPEARAIGIGVVLTLVATSLMSRQAGRYIFPCYAVVAALGAAAAAGSKLGDVLQQRPRSVFALVIFVATLRVLFAGSVYREINLLPGTRVTYESPRASLEQEHLQDEAGPHDSRHLRWSGSFRPQLCDRKLDSDPRRRPPAS